MPTLTAEQKLTNLAEIVKRQTTPTRRNVGRPDSYGASKQEMAEAAAQLAEYVLAYLAGTLEDTQTDDLPF
jgi:phage/plasmid primase-like uncharacterized protein